MIEPVGSELEGIQLAEPAVKNTAAAAAVADRVAAAPAEGVGRLPRRLAGLRLLAPRREKAESEDTPRTAAVNHAASVDG